ncbi:MAG: hypothetical protein LBB50_04160 [Oscillospiraceae bacterium]|jgi:hypothetical protein|nr:hypothetical protein [Oscillospiraceae bacterium]
MPLTERDFAMFEPARTQPQKKPQEPIRKVQDPEGESLGSKKLREHKVWMQSLVAYAVSGAVTLGLLMMIQTETQHHRATVENQLLLQQLQNARQRNISVKTQIERKYSLEMIQDTALRTYHMVPVEGRRVTYLQQPLGDQ